MVKITPCGSCKYYKGLDEDKTTRFCEAFPEGKSGFEPESGKDCANGLRYEPNDKIRKLIENGEMKMPI